MKVSIIGLGWVGAPLAHTLVSLGHSVKGTTRTSEKAEGLRSFGIEVHLLDKNLLPAPELFDCDVCILNIPPFEGQLTWFRQWPWKPNTHVIFLSSTSVYGSLEGIVTETMSPLPDSPNAKLLFDEENWIRQKFEPYTVLRLSGLLDDDRHPGKHLSGRKDIKGRNQPVNLIHKKDVIGSILAVMEKKITGVVNVSSDEHRSKKDFYTAYAKSKSLTLPEFAEDDLTSGKTVSNKKLKEFYELKVPLMP